MFISILVALIFCLLLFYYYYDNYKIFPKHFSKPPSENHNNAPRVSFHFFPAPGLIEWKSPRTLFLSSARNTLSFANRLIGHVSVEIYCPDFYPNGKAFYISTGMTDTGKDIVRHIFREQVALGMILTRYPGTLEETGKLNYEIHTKRMQGRVQTVSYLTSKHNCQRAIQFLKEYEDKGYNDVYAGLDAHPRYESGSGCANFAWAIAQLIGVDQDEFQKAWIRKVRLPESLIGFLGGREKVPFFRLFSQKASRWALEDEEAVEIHFWDPDGTARKLSELGKAMEKKSNKSPDDCRMLKHAKSYEFIFDRSQVEAKGAIWLKGKYTP